eukprot:Rhum_TRINITY_DN14705_c46_g1::Rhum_TRINITY_DN14705_c46_g1_i1::g.112404::m.112404
MADRARLSDSQLRQLSHMEATPVHWHLRAGAGVGDGDGDDDARLPTESPLRSLPPELRAPAAHLLEGMPSPAECVTSDHSKYREYISRMHRLELSPLPDWVVAADAAAAAVDADADKRAEDAARKLDFTAATAAAAAAATTNTTTTTAAPSAAPQRAAQRRSPLRKAPQPQPQPQQPKETIQHGTFTPSPKRGAAAAAAAATPTPRRRTASIVSSSGGFGIDQPPPGASTGAAVCANCGAPGHHTLNCRKRQGKELGGQLHRMPSATSVGGGGGGSSSS